MLHCVDCCLHTQSCLELKNYEAVFAIVGGLGSREIQRASNSWQVKKKRSPNNTIVTSSHFQMVTDHLKSVYAEMKDLASPELNYHRYKQEIVSLHQIACVPKLGIYNWSHSCDTITRKWFLFRFHLSRVRSNRQRTPKFSPGEERACEFPKEKKVH